MPTSIEGRLVHDYKGWSGLEWQRLSPEKPGCLGINIGNWAKDRIHDIPEGAYVRVTIEVLDPEPA